eukprot:5204827-Pyramimonas_sp.AAC.1
MPFRRPLLPLGASLVVRSLAAAPGREVSGAVPGTANLLRGGQTRARALPAHRTSQAVSPSPLPLSIGLLAEA